MWKKLQMDRWVNNRWSVKALLNNLFRSKYLKFLETQMKAAACEAILIIITWGLKCYKQRGKKFVYINYRFFIKNKIIKKIYLSYPVHCCDLLKSIKGHGLIGFKIYSSCIHNSTYFSNLFPRYTYKYKVHW